MISYEILIERLRLPGDYPVIRHVRRRRLQVLRAVDRRPIYRRQRSASPGVPVDYPLCRRDRHLPRRRVRIAAQMEEQAQSRITASRGKSKELTESFQTS